MGEIINMPNQMNKKKSPKKKKEIKKISFRTRIIGMVLLFTIILFTGISSIDNSLSIGTFLFIGFWMSMLSLAIIHITKDDMAKNKNGIR